MESVSLEKRPENPFIPATMCQPGQKVLSVDQEVNPRQIPTLLLFLPCTSRLEICDQHISVSKSRVHGILSQRSNRLGQYP